MYISIFNNLIMKMEGQPLIYNNNLLSKYGKPEVTIQLNGDLLLNEQAPVTMEFLRKHTDNGVMEPLKLMNR
jgi:membrane-anchored glycerophosphoryl diester phosphodiesterase (GDPDase)